MNMTVQTDSLKMMKIYFVTIVRQIFCLTMVISLLVLRNNENDNVANFCGLIKVFILVVNCVYLIRHIIKNSAYELSCGTWMFTCIVDACFSLQILISVLFHFQDFIENSIIVFNIYLMLYLSFDTMLNLIVLLLTVMSVKPYSIRNDETLKLVSNDNSSKEIGNNFQDVRCSFASSGQNPCKGEVVVSPSLS